MTEKKHWREITPYLDQALELEGQARAIWLRELDASAPEIAAEVHAYLEQSDSIEAKGFLADDAMVEMARASLAGQRLGAYTLKAILGQGGMGTVWLAKRNDGRFEGHAAVKLLNAALLGRPAEQKFVREGALLAKLRHPHISQLIDAGVAPGGQPYLVLEYVAGERIDAYCEQHGLNTEARVRLFLDVLAAVAHAHSHLVVHRDIKPSNILVTAQGQVKLLDFGVAALLRPGMEEAELTHEVVTGFTPEYAAPEQLLFEPVTTATDVYALGLVLFVLLAGRHPTEPEGKSHAEIMRATLDETPRRPSQLAADPQRGRTLRGDLDNIVAKALDRDPAARYTTAESFAQDLKRFLAHEPILARPDSALYRTRKFVRRHRGGVATGVVTALLLMGAMVMTAMQTIEARRQRDAALYQSKRAEFQAKFAYQIMSEVGGSGQPITIKELMERGIQVLEKNYTDDPHFVIGMLINISGRYMDVGDTNGELAALVKAEGIARQLQDPDAIAKVQCNTVETELAAGQPQRADARMRDALANLAKIDNPSLDRQVECGMAQTRLLWSQDKLDDAIGAALNVVRLMQARNMTTDVNYFSILSMLDVMLTQAGRLREEQEWNQHGMDLLERIGREGTLTMSSFRSNRGRALFAAGEIRAAYDLQRKLIEGIAAQQGADGVASGYAHRFGLSQVRIEETDAGLAWLDRAVKGAAAQNNQGAQIGALLSRARAGVLLGRTDAALADIETMERLAQANPLENRSALQTAREVRARVMSMRDDAQASLAQLEGLLQELGYPKQKTAAQLGSVLTLKSQVQLSLNQPAAALATAQEAVTATTAIAVRPEQSADVGAALMSLAKAQRATGDQEGARASAERAAKALSIGLGESHSETRAALQFGSLP